MALPGQRELVAHLCAHHAWHQSSLLSAVRALYVIVAHGDVDPQIQLGSLGISGLISQLS